MSFVSVIPYNIIFRTELDHMPEFDRPFRPVIIEEKVACRPSETNAELLGILLGLLKQLRLSLEVITPNNAKDFQNSLKRHPDEVVITWLTYVSLVFDLLDLENIGLPSVLIDRMRDFTLLVTSRKILKPYMTQYPAVWSSAVHPIKFRLGFDPREFIFSADQIIREILQHYDQDVTYDVDRELEMKKIAIDHAKAVVKARERARAEAKAKLRVPA